MFTVIGRLCPWEIVHYARRCAGRRIAVRFARRAMPIGMNQRTIWTRYYTPRELYRPFAPHFTLEHHRRCACSPRRHLTWVRDRHPSHTNYGAIDRRLGGWPLLRAIGDHFLIVMRKRPIEQVPMIERDNTEIAAACDRLLRAPDSSLAASQFRCCTSSMSTRHTSHSTGRCCLAV